MHRLSLKAFFVDRAEDAVVVAGDEYAEFRWDSRVPGEEVLQIVRIETFTSISGTDEDVGFGW